LGGGVATENHVNVISERVDVTGLSTDDAAPANTDTYNKGNLGYTLDSQKVIVTVDYLGENWNIDLTRKDKEPDYCRIKKGAACERALSRKLTVVAVR